MAEVTRRLDRFHFPGTCVNCRAPTDFACPIIAWNGFDFLLARSMVWAEVPVPVCDACRSRRVWAGRIAGAAIAAWSGLLIATVAMLWRPARGSQNEVITLAATAGLVGTLWYARHRMRRDLDRSVLGVCGKGVRPATNEATLWFRDPPAPEDDFGPALDGRSTRHPATSAGYAELARREEEATETLVAGHRLPALARLEAEDFRLEARFRWLVLAVGLFTLVGTWYSFHCRNAMAVDETGMPTDVIMAGVGLLLVGLGGYTVDLAGERIVRSLWGLRKPLDRTTTTIRKYEPNGLHIVDGQGARLWITKHIMNYDRLLAECQLRTDVLSAGERHAP